MIETPTLAIDAVLYPDGRIPARAKLERRIVAGLCAHLATHGFTLVAVHDYEEETKVTSVAEALELVFNLDQCNLHFDGADGSERCAVLVLGNGVDCVSDWFATIGDDFDVAMAAFNPCLFE